MPTNRVNEPILDGGIKTANYQNGRLLSAEDLRVDQEAVRLRAQRLGLAVGAGVVSGLEVSGRDRIDDLYAALQVSAGLAVNARGQTLCLENPVALTIPPSGPAAHPATESAGFTPFQPPAPTTPDQAPLSLRLLVISPARGYQGLALSPTGVLAGHDRRYGVEGVEFKLLPFTSPFREERSPLLRNRLAHWCIYGPDSLPVRLARQCGSALTPDDLPLALIGITGHRVLFVDPWTVRRSPAGSPAEPAGPVDLLGARRPQNELFYRQFQQHLAGGLPPSAFRYLPPVGYLPEPYDWRTFLAMAQAQEMVLDDAFLQARVDPAWRAEPIDLNSAPLLWVYTPQGANYTLFLRREKAQEQIELETGNAILVEATLAGAAGDLSSVRITAAGDDGSLHTAQPEGRRFRLPGLPAGPYTLWARAPGFKTISRRIHLQPGETERVGLMLQPSAPMAPPPACPEERYLAAWLKPWKQRHLVMLWRHPRSGDLPPEIRHWQPMALVEHDLLHWLRSWGGYLAATQPELPIDLGNVRILVNPELPSRAYRNRPWGYVLYGAGGARLPLALAPRFKARRDLSRKQLIRSAWSMPEGPWAALPEVAVTRRPARKGLFPWLLSLFVVKKGEGGK